MGPRVWSLMSWVCSEGSTGLWYTVRVDTGGEVTLTPVSLTAVGKSPDVIHDYPQRVLMCRPDLLWD